MKCPSCHAPVPAGETICFDCGTELVFTAPAPAEAPVESEAAHDGTAERAASASTCPDCGEHVRPDANGLCPVCGHDFGDAVEIDEDEFFKPPPSLEDALEIERERLRAVAGAASRGANSTPPAAAAPPSAPEAPSEPLPLPGDRHRTRWSGTGDQAAVTETPPTLSVEGGQTVFFDGKMTAEVRLLFDQVLIGRRDPPQGHYPDIDLAHFRHIDPHVSRRHARVYREQGRWFLEDLCDNDATYLHDRAHVLNHDVAELKDGDRILISDSVVMTFRTRR